MTSSELLSFAGYRYWATSLLPALVGTTLPFWLNPPGFYFKWGSAILFLIASLLTHTGFSLLLAFFNNKTANSRTKSRLLLAALISLLVAIILGLCLNYTIQLNEKVHDLIFIIFGVTVFFTGMLYVVPPFSLNRQIGGETILYFGFGMLPVIGAYLIQAGDLTRTVYIASMPIVVSMGLWVWLSELISKEEDKQSGRKTIVMIFTPLIANRFVTPLIIFILYATLILAVFARHSLNSLSLAALLSLVYAIKIIKISWYKSDDVEEIPKTNRYAFIIHFSICVIIIFSSLIGSLI